MQIEYHKRHRKILTLSRQKRSAALYTIVILSFRKNIHIKVLFFSIYVGSYNTLRPSDDYIRQWTGGRFKEAYELLNFQCCMKCISFNVWARYFVWNFKGYLWNSTQNILPIHWKMWILFTSKNLRALRFKSSKVFLKRPPGHQWFRWWIAACSTRNRGLNQYWLTTNWTRTNKDT